MFNDAKLIKIFNLEFNFMKLDENGKRCDNNIKGQINGLNYKSLPQDCDEDDLRECLKCFINNRAFNGISDDIKQEIVKDVADNFWKI